MSVTLINYKAYKAMSKTTGFVFKYSDGGIVVSSAHFNKRDCIKWAELQFKSDWKTIRKYGHHIVKVELKEI